MIPEDLIPTREAAKLLGLAGTDGVRYHIRIKNLRGFKNKRGYLFVSKEEVMKLIKPEFTEVKINEEDNYSVDLDWEHQVMEWVDFAVENGKYD